MSGNNTKGSASPSPTNLNRTPSPSSSSLGNRYDVTSKQRTSSPVVRKLSSVKVSTPPTLAPVLDTGEQNDPDTRCRARPKPVFMLGDEEETLSRTHKVTAAVGAAKTRRQRRTTISNAAEPMSELNKNTAKNVVCRSPYSNLYNLNIVEYQQQQQQQKMKRFGGLSEIVSNQQRVNFLLQRDNTIPCGGEIHKSKSSPALISQAVRELPVQTHVSASQNSLASLLKQLAQENIHKDILSTLPSPCFKLVNSPPSPNTLTGESSNISSPKFFPGESTPSPKHLTGENTPPPSFFQAASPASWKNYVDLQRRIRSPSEGESGSIHRASSLGSNDRENAMKARNRIKSKSDINIAQQHQHARTSERNSITTKNTPPSARCQLFANRNDNFYSSPTDISMEMNKDLALDPIPPPLSMDIIDGNDILRTGDFHSESSSDGSTTSIKEIEFLFILSETLLKLTTDSHITGQVSDCIPEIKRKRPDVIPSAEALKLAKLLLTSEAMRVSSYALRFSQSQQKKGVIKPTEMLKKGRAHLSFL